MVTDQPRWQWHQLGHMQITCTLLQITTIVPHHSFFTGQMLFLTPNQQCQSIEGSINCIQSTTSEENPGRSSNLTSLFLMFYNIHSVFTSVRTSRTDLNWLDMLAKCVWMQTKQIPTVHCTHKCRSKRLSHHIQSLMCLFNKRNFYL